MTHWVVVGGGAAGCVVAARLSERSDRQVTLLEAGPDHGPNAVAGDVGPKVDDPSRLTAVRVRRRPGDDPTPYFQGRGLGGSSIINAGVVTGSSPPVHLLPLEAPWSDGSVGAALLAADSDAARVRLIRRNHHRVTAADAYLRPARGRPNLTVLTDRRVRTVALDGRRAVGVALADGTEVDADRVVLCSGAIGTPVILLRSAVDTPGVGEGLQDHPAFTITLRLRADAVDAAAPTISVAADHADHQLVALNHLSGAPDLGALVVSIPIVRSRGRVSLPDPEGEPLVELGQFGDRRDLEDLGRAVERTLELFAHPAWEPVVAEIALDEFGTPPAAVSGGLDAITDWVERHAGGHHHVSATCADGVVTDGGRLRGYEHLFVCDASLFRAVPRRDPYVSLIDLAERTVAGWH